MDQGLIKEPLNTSGGDACNSLIFNLHQKKQHQKNMIHHGETLFVNFAKVGIGQLCHKQCVKKAARGNGYLDR